MNPKHFTEESPGELISVPSQSGELGWAFLPDSLPPSVSLGIEVLSMAEISALSLGRLNGLGAMLPNPMLLVRPFVSREALASSRMEGTQADFTQLALLEAEPERVRANADVQEVVNYMVALQSGWSELDDRIITTSMLQQLHDVLMSGVRGSTKEPGALRTKQVLIGSPGQTILEARFVPPPPLEIRALLDDLCRYIGQFSPLSALVRLAYIHYQFETIHPFMDGNGRLGRLIMPLILKSWQMLDFPLLYLSEYFERHRDEYIDRLYKVSTQGDWQGWVTFVLIAINAQAKDAYARGRELVSARESLRQTYQLNRSSSRILIIIDQLFERPTITINEAASATGVTHRAASGFIRTLVDDGILIETTGQKRNLIFMAPQIYEAILGQPYEPR